MKKLMLGNEAIARGAYESGVTVSTAYPGTPSTEISEYMCEYDEINVEWSPNEKVALEVGIGASIAGARAIVSMKHVGLNVAADPLLSVSYPGVNGGLVVVVADDPGQHSSQNEQDTRYFGLLGKIPVIEPSNSEECKNFVGKAIRISEDFDTPVILRLSTRVSHSKSIVEIKDKEEYNLRAYDKNPNKYIVAPAVAKKRRIVAEARLKKLGEYAESTELNSIEYNDLNIGIITSGIAYEYCKEVLPDASIFKLGLSYPLPKNNIRDFVNKCKTVYVVEELEPIFETQIKSFGLKVIGKEVIPTIDELSPSIIRKSILKEEKKGINKELLPEIPNRPPTLCVGCHHRGVFYVLKKLGLNVSGDIGCYTLAAFPPLNSMDTSICMGASIGMAFGFEKARGKKFSKKSIAVIGDSTFIHSGITGLIDIVYNKGNSTVIILDNSITAMTGHQDNPTTGRTIRGEETKSINFVALAKAIGIERVFSVDAYDIDSLQEIITREVNSEEPSVIITRRPCALLKTNKKSLNKMAINPQICKGCKSCLKIGCPAISFIDGKVSINPLQCNGCGLCKKLCNLDAIGEVI